MGLYMYNYIYGAGQCYRVFRGDTRSFDCA